jgi:hypothetical protein
VVLTVKVPLDCPLGIVSPVGLGVAAALSLESVMATPELGAGAVRLTVPRDELPPVTELGLTVTEETPDVVAVGANTTSTQ